MKSTKLVLVVSFFISFFSLNTGATSLKRPAVDNLTWEFAKARASQIKTVDYELFFKFDKGQKGFSGKTLIKTQLTRLDQPLSIDFIYKKIESVTVNNQPIKNYTSQVGSIAIPAKYLKSQTDIEIQYYAEYSTDGQGFQSAIDPEDKSEYLSTDFEPYYTHRFFPCFNQPDLKATYAVTVDAPADWKVIGNELIAEAKTTGERTLTTFTKTPRFSTYLLFVAAGPFVQWQDKHGKIPLEIYARKTLAKYVDAEKLFAVTKNGLSFYIDFFGHPYPYSKYGQVFVPEFAWGGMENPGAIALSERNIFRGPVTQARLDDRNSLILHEMAHMWFGDLVTMKWWNDLWLNESFATYTAVLAMDKALGTSMAWIDFFSEKTWGYWQDQLVTTHPIETAVPDVQSAKGNFDGITYAKGAAALKQLHYFVGDKAFQTGVQNYFKKYALGNTTRQDFTNEIATAAGVSLDDWTHAWLQTAGPNRVQAEWTCRDGKIASFAMVQKPSVSQTLSPHRTQIGFFQLKGDSLKLVDSQDMTYSSAHTANTNVVGKACPDFVDPNMNDQDYALFAFDPISLKSVRRVITGGTNDTLLRVMTWNTLGQMVRDAQLSTLDFMNLALEGLATEQNEDVLSIVLGRFSALRRTYLGYLSKEQRLSYAQRLEETVWQRISKTKAGSSEQMLFFDFYVATAQSQKAATQLIGFLQNVNLPQGFKLDQDRRWDILLTLTSLGYSDTSQLIAQEESKDTTMTGKRNAFAARVAIPRATAKESFWNELKNADKIPFSTLRQASGRFHNNNYPELSQPFIDKFFKRVASIDWKSQDSLIDIYFGSLFPENICSEKVLKTSQSELKKSKNLIPLVKRAWLESNEELEKCVAIRRFSSKNSSSLL